MKRNPSTDSPGAPWLSQPRPANEAAQVRGRCGRIALILTAACLSAPLFGQPVPELPPESEFVRWMNLGKAYLENRNSADAIATLQKAVETRPDSAAALRNLGRAYMLAKNAEQAIEALQRASGIEPDSAATAYLIGLNYVRQSKFADALPFLEQAARLDPHTAALRFQLAGVYQALQRHEDARQQLLETVRLDPLHASGHFKLSVYARQRGDQQELQARTREFMRLRSLFGDETRNAEMLETCFPTKPEAPPPEGVIAGAERQPINVRFVDVTQDVFKDEELRKISVADVLDMDEDGKVTLFAADGRTGYRLLRASDDGSWQGTPAIPLEKETEVRQCLVGDFYSEKPPGLKDATPTRAQHDVALVTSTGIQLLLRTGESSFVNVTTKAGMDSVEARHAAWVDVEHDGDLDLLLSRATGLEVRQNNGDGTFQDVTAALGLGGTESAVQSTGVELDGDVAVDLLVARDTLETLILENLRAGVFRPRPDPPGPLPPARLLLTDDFDHDGRPDIVLIQEHGAVMVMGSNDRRPTIEVHDLTIRSAALLDADNDGTRELVIGGGRTGATDRGAVELFRFDRGRWQCITEPLGLAAVSIPDVRGILAFDADSDGDTDLTLLTADGLRQLRNDGGNANGQIKVRLSTIKTNPSGFGTHIEVRRNSFWVTRQVDRWPIEIGVGPHRRLDTVQTVWTNGVVDNQIDVAVERKPLPIIEKNVATGSCPFLYAWNGQSFRFVTDLLGNSPIGLPVSREEMLPADPDEIVWIGDARTFPLRDDQYALTVTEEFREVLYLDEVRLMAVDHPIGTEAHPTDKIMFPPFPPSEVWLLGQPQWIVRGMGDDGIDRTEALRAMDGVFAPPGKLQPPPLRGMCEPLALELDFGPMHADASLVLALTGWLQYGDGSRNIALSQNSSIPVVPPLLEAQSETGEIRPIDVVVGIPAGKTKTILVDLTGKLPQGTRNLQLRTTFEIRWDRIALFQRVLLSREDVHETRPARAKLSWRGFCEIESRAPGHPTTPDFDKLFVRPKWRRTPEGWCSRYGDVRELLMGRDDRMVIINAGDALLLEFAPGFLPELQPGLTRDFFFYSVGWDKDGDHNVVEGDRVDPLPRNESPLPERSAGFVRVIDVDGERFEVPVSDWQLEFNTRWVPGDRFEDGPPASDPRWENGVSPPMKDRQAPESAGG